MEFPRALYFCPLSVSAEKDFHIHLGLELDLGRVDFATVHAHLDLFRPDPGKPTPEEIAEVEIVPLHEVNVESSGLVVRMHGLEAEAPHPFGPDFTEAEVGGEGDELALLVVVNREIGMPVASERDLRSRAGTYAASAES